jgi:hypothetical protein
MQIIKNSIRSVECASPMGLWESHRMGITPEGDLIELNGREHEVETFFEGAALADRLSIQDKPWITGRLTVVGEPSLLF